MNPGKHTKDNLGPVDEQPDQPEGAADRDRPRHIPHTDRSPHISAVPARRNVRLNNRPLHAVADVVDRDQNPVENRLLSNSEHTRTRRHAQHRYQKNAPGTKTA